MSCATCSTTIEEATGSLDGVEEADANFATDEGTVEYDPETVSLAEIYGAIEDAGYEPARERQTIEIGGMSCATCSEANERAIESVPGVIDASVNFAADEAHGRADEAQVDLERLQADALGARRGELGEQRLVWAARDRPEEEEELEDEEEVDSGHRRAGVGGRREEEEGEDRPERRAGHDIRDAPPPARAGPVAEVADDHLVERADHRADREQERDHETR